MSNTRAPTSPATAHAAKDDPQPTDDELTGSPLDAQSIGVASPRTGLGRVTLGLTGFCLLLGSTVFAQTPPAQKTAGGTLTIDPTQMQKLWTGKPSR